MDRAIISAAQWVVGKALAPVTDGVLQSWEASKNFGLNIEALKAELLLVQATLEIASQKKLPGGAMEKLLQKLRDSAHNAEDLLDELDYFRIHDELHGTFDSANEHAKGGVHNLILSARHTTKAVGKPLALSTSSPFPSTGDPREKDARQCAGYRAWPCTRKRARGSSSSTPNANQADEDVRGCMRKLGKPLPCSSFTPVHDDGDDSGKSTLCGAYMCQTPQRDQHVEQTPKLEFNRVDISERMKHIVEKVQPVRREVCTMLQSCGDNNVPGIAQSRLITTDRSIEPKLYGRDLMVNSIIHDITNGKYCGNDLTVLPIVGSGGIGKTTMIQHIYNKIKVQNHFQVMIWVCVSVSFDLNKILKEMKRYIPQVIGEKEDRAEEVIEQRLKFKRFLLVLDDIWGFSNEDDWERLLLPLKTSGEKGSMILVTTRFQPIAQMVKTTNDSIELQGLEPEEFRKLFLAFVFGNEQCRNDYIFLLDTGYKIMEKLKGNPLAAKTVGRLLRNDLSLRYWRKVLESKEWERQTGDNDITPALKLSYDYLPFQQQQCFSYSALFPEDYRFSSSQLINLWIGLDLLQRDGRSQTFDDIGLRYLNNLVTRGFFREDQDYCGRPCYIMHDLLHDLALRVASHECLSLHRSNVRSVEIRPCIRHLSIIIDDIGDDNAVSDEEFKSELRNLKTRLKVEHLQTLMLFGKMDKSFANSLGDLFREANVLRVLHLPNMTCPVESMLHKFSALVHLRYLCLGAGYSEMHLPHAISRFYHLRILDLTSWYGYGDLPKDMSNLINLCHFNALVDDQYSKISNVGKLKHLQGLKFFEVNKEREGFELNQLEHLTELRELGIYNLEKIQTKEEAARAKLIDKNCLERLTLDWDSGRSSAKPDVEALVLEGLQPHGNLQVLCIREHRGPSCPTWLGDELAVEALQSLHLVGVSWENFPSLGKMWELGELWLEGFPTVKELVTEQRFCRLVRLTLVGLAIFEKWVPPLDTDLFPLLKVLIIRDCPKLSGFPFLNHIVCPREQERKINWFPKLEKLEIDKCPQFLLGTPIPWTGTLSYVCITEVKLLKKLVYSKSFCRVELSHRENYDLHSFGQLLFFNNLTNLEKLEINKCPPLELKHLVRLTSLKALYVHNSDGVVGSLRGQGDVEWQLPVESIDIRDCGVSGKELTELLAHLPRLTSLLLSGCRKITRLVMGVDLQQTTKSVSEMEEEDDGVMIFPAHLSNSLCELYISDCPRLVVLVDPPTLFPHGDDHNKKTGGGGGLQALRSLETFEISSSPKFLSACLFSSPSRHVLPSSLKFLSLNDLEGIRTLEPLLNLTSLIKLQISGCGEDLRCEDLQPLLTTGGQLTRLTVLESPRFFAGWDPRRVLHDGGGEQQQLQLLPQPPSSSPLRELLTNDTAGFLAAHICSFMSSSLTELYLGGNKEMERFTKEQEDALHLLASLEELSFIGFGNLQHLPAGLHKLTNLKKLWVIRCPAVSSLPEDGLPNSLQQLYVAHCSNEELKQKCSELGGTIPKIYT